MVRLSLGQRIVLVIGLAVALLAFGEWAKTWGTHYYTGWTGYSPIYVPYVGGLQPWARLLIWLGLIAIWIFTSVALLRTPRRLREHFLNKYQQVVLVVGIGVGLYVIGSWVSAWTPYCGWAGCGMPRRVATYYPGGPSRWQPWQLFLIWLGLTSIWLTSSVWVVRSRRSGSEGPDE